MISYIIPHKGRHGLLYEHLELLSKSPLLAEVIVVDDHNGEDFVGLLEDYYPWVKVCSLEEGETGTSAARNKGASWASGDYLLFVGSDCLPHRNLLPEHFAAYLAGNHVNQGYTPFAPETTGTPFMEFLQKSGVQANWQSLIDENGDWLKSGFGFCLTTNFGIDRELFYQLGQFSSLFVEPAWDDIEFGQRLRLANLPTNILPNAINFHWHQYGLSDYVNRQIMEGRNRWKLAVSHPQIAPSILNKDFFAEANGIDLPQLVRVTNSLSANEDVYAQYAGKVLAVGSALGAKQALSDMPVMRYILYANKQPSIFIAAAAEKDLLERGQGAYAEHCVGWAIKEESDNPYTFMFAYDVYTRTGNEVLANHYKEKALEAGITV